jgi:hypothetical protein
MYKQLQEHLADTNETTTCFEYKAESSFQFAYKYWNKIKQKLNNWQFRSDTEEINFFQMLKPRFTAEIEYYELLYHAVVFEPAYSQDAIKFWNRELLRLQNFRESNEAFLCCYNNGAPELLPYYFLRRYNIQASQRVKLYDAGTQHLTNGDPLVAEFLALQRFEPYVLQKLAALHK